MAEATESRAVRHGGFSRAPPWRRSPANQPELRGISQYEAKNATGRSQVAYDTIEEESIRVPSAS